MQSNQNSTQDINKKFDAFFRVYQAMGMLLNELPIHPQLMDKIRFEIDGSFLWIKEAIQAAIQNAEAASKTNPDIKVIGAEDAPKASVSETPAEPVTH